MRLKHVAVGLAGLFVLALPFSAGAGRSTTQTPQPTARATVVAAASPSPSPIPTVSSTAVAQVAQVAQPTAPSPAPTAPTAPTANAPAAASADGQLPATVVRVIDGDTVDVNLAGKTERLRLIGMDTPEVVDPRKPVQCYGREASDRAKTLLPAGTAVRIAADPTQDTRDTYGRLLVYLWMPDGRLFEEVLIREGYAHEYTYARPYQRQADLRAAQADARSSGRGLWAPSACNGNTTQPATAATAAPSAGGSPSGQVYYANCAAARAAGAAPIRRGQPGYRTELDRNGDGVACE